MLLITRVRRRAIAGAVAGVVPGLILTQSLGASGVPVGVLGGVGFSLGFHRRRGRAGAGLVGAALGVVLWLVVYLTTVPLVGGGSLRWTPTAVRTALSGLGTWLVAGAILGPVAVTLQSVLDRWRPREGRAGEGSDESTRIVVLGGGFAGLYAARRLESLFGPDRSVELVLVSRDNATLFTPMLPEVAGGSLDPADIATPLRTALRRTQVVEASATGIDIKDKRLRLDTGWRPRDAGDGGVGSDGPVDECDTVAYDHLVLALGSVPDRKGVDPEGECSLDFKTLGDAMEMRDRVVACFERADATDDRTEREALTRFVIGGGGFAGVELAGALNDLAHGLVRHYPNVDRTEVEVVLVHSRERILPDVDEALAEYARAEMSERGVGFELGVRVAEARHGRVELDDGRRLRAETFVWTAGNRPHPLIADADLPCESSGAVSVTETLSVPGTEGVWAAGDCAAVRDAETGDRHPNTAQYATRAGAAAAENVHAAVTGGDPEPFTHRSRGSLAVIGHQVAVADILGWQFSGRSAWLLWRGVYLFKLPGLAQKVQVALGWATDLFFPRNLVRTGAPRPQGAGRERRPRREDRRSGGRRPDGGPR